MVDDYNILVRTQLASQTVRREFRRPCNVEYIFEWKGTPIDCSNCIGSKMIEDCLFPDDSPKVVKSIKITSLKSVVDKATVIIKEI